MNTLNNKWRREKVLRGVLKENRHQPLCSTRRVYAQTNNLAFPGGILQELSAGNTCKQVHDKRLQTVTWRDASVSHWAACNVCVCVCDTSPGSSSAAPSRDPPHTTSPPSAWNPRPSPPHQTWFCNIAASSRLPTTCRTHGPGYSLDWLVWCNNSWWQEQQKNTAETSCVCLWPLDETDSLNTRIGI